MLWSKDRDLDEEEFSLDDFVACVVEDCPDWDLGIGKGGWRGKMGGWS
jgi:hypothetical protein